VFDLELLKIWIELNPDWISISIFIIAFIESFVGIGLFMPGVILLAMASGIAYLANVHPLEIFLYGYIGACLGDILSFLIGGLFQERINSIWPFSKYPDALEKGRLFFNKYGIYGILIGRFMGPIRTVLPAIAGTMGMSKHKFLFIDLTSGIPWAFFYILSPYYLTQSFPKELPLFVYLLGLIFIVVFIVGIRIFLQRFNKA
jgi:membrane protein DedA with SNARE-associated domain